MKTLERTSYDSINKEIKNKNGGKAILIVLDEDINGNILWKRDKKN